MAAGPLLPLNDRKRLLGRHHPIGLAVAHFGTVQKLERPEQLQFAGEMPDTARTLTVMVTGLGASHTKAVIRPPRETRTLAAPVPLQKHCYPCH